MRWLTLTVGAAYINKGETDQALSDCNKAILLDPNNAPTRFGYQ